MRNKSQLKDIFYCLLISLPFVVYAVATMDGNFQCDSFYGTPTYNLGNIRSTTAMHPTALISSEIAKYGIQMPARDMMFRQNSPCMSGQNVLTGTISNHWNSDAGTIHYSNNGKQNSVSEESHMNNLPMPLRSNYGKERNNRSGIFDGLKLSDLSTANEGQPFFTVNSSGSEDDFEEGGTTDPEDTYNDVPIGDGTFFLFLLTIVYVLVKKAHIKKSHNNNFVEKNK